MFRHLDLLEHDDVAYSAVGVDKDSHVLMEFDGKKAKDSEGNIVNSVSPKGISGGGLFLLEGSVVSLNPDKQSEWTTKLMGMLVEQPSNRRLLSFIRIHILIDAVRTELAQGKLA